ncbi:MAG: hypothetical protein M1429_02415 [Patescibacteria group bacterium]|nr:hypothetical protein [Patescibacteria group bacterium]
MSAKKESRSQAWVISTIVVTSAFSMPFLMFCVWCGILYLQYGSSQNQILEGARNLSWLLTLMVITGIASGSVYALNYVKSRTLINQPTEYTVPTIMVFALVSLVGVLVADFIIDGAIAKNSYQVASEFNTDLVKAILLTIVQVGVFGGIVWNGFRNWEKSLIRSEWNSEKGGEKMETQESRMSPALLIWGIILVIAGIAGYVYTAPQMDQINSGLGQFAAALNQNAADQFQTWRLEYYSSIVAIVIGGLLFIGGIIQQTQKK